MKATKKDFQNNYKKNRLYFDGVYFWHYEPYFGNLVIVAYITNRSISYAHGYYPPHPIGKKVLKAIPNTNYR